MVSPGEIAGVVLLLAINTVLAAISTRFARLVALTRLGTIIAILAVVTLVLTASTMLLSGVFHMGINVHDRMIAVLLAIGLPMAIGVTIDFLWVASPEAVEAEIAD